MTALARQVHRQPVEPEGLDDCIIMYANERRCECLDEHLLEVTLNERGQPVCRNCGERRV